MEPLIFVILSVVLAVWIGVFFGIRRWGPGTLRRSVLCPEKQIPARVTFLRREGSFGSLKVVDVTACSLFSGAPVTCQKNCMG
ncbi:MAG: hypothetical protein A3H27_00415 [Acidobacteria bacterium RIFCSPLOWO2_02_FULL_59_13]|nr:MAG: hypothetical protein A3H27_00415 [Acidobacteria bacterium RIFCSPLOWO2_02_FULL_59_13]